MKARSETEGAEIAERTSTITVFSLILVVGAVFASFAAFEEYRPFAFLLVIAFGPLLLVAVARSKGHLRRTYRGIGAVSWSMWLTILLSYAVAPLALVFIFRTARPTSWWAERFYDHDKLERSRDLYWSDPSTLPPSSDLAKIRLNSTGLFGASREHVEGYMTRCVAVVGAFETDRLDLVTIPPDLLHKPRFRRERGGYDIKQTEEATETIRETVQRLHWLQQSRPWLLHNRPRTTPPTKNPRITTIEGTWKDHGVT